MTINQEINRMNETEESVNIQELLMLCLGRWHWFVASVVIVLGIAVLYVLRSEPVYTRTASLLIKENAKGQSLRNEVGSAFADMGIFQSNTNVNNELIALLKSKFRRIEVVRGGAVAIESISTSCR